MPPTTLPHTHSQYLGRLAAKTAIIKAFLKPQCGKDCWYRWWEAEYIWEMRRFVFSLWFLPPDERLQFSWVIWLPLQIHIHCTLHHECWTKTLEFKSFLALVILLFQCITNFFVAEPKALRHSWNSPFKADIFKSSLTQIKMVLTWCSEKAQCLIANTSHVLSRISQPNSKKMS